MKDVIREKVAQTIKCLVHSNPVAELREIIIYPWPNGQRDHIIPVFKRTESYNMSKVGSPAGQITVKVFFVGRCVSDNIYHPENLRPVPNLIALSVTHDAYCISSFPHNQARSHLIATILALLSQTADSRKPHHLIPVTQVS